MSTKASHEDHDTKVTTTVRRPQHGPVLNPDCTRELVLDIPAEEVTKAYASVAGSTASMRRFRFRAGKVPESVG